MAIYDTTNHNKHNNNNTNNNNIIEHTIVIINVIIIRTEPTESELRRGHGGSRAGQRVTDYNLIYDYILRNIIYHTNYTNQILELSSTYLHHRAVPREEECPHDPLANSHVDTYVRSLNEHSVLQESAARRVAVWRVRSGASRVTGVAQSAQRDARGPAPHPPRPPEHRDPKAP